VSFELVEELSHARCVEFSDHDDGAGLEAIAARDVHDGGGHHRGDAESEDADR
jgi:hypothetical protein